MKTKAIKKRTTKKKPTEQSNKSYQHDIKRSIYMELRERGEDLDTIMTRLRLTKAEFVIFENVCHDEEAFLLKNKSAGAIFVNYMLDQKHLLSDLKDVHREFKKNKQTAGAVSAIRLRSEILDKILNMGQELGVIVRTAKKQEIELQMTIEHLETHEIKALIVDDIKGLMRMVEQYGDQNILDIKVPELHRQLPSPTKKAHPTGHKSNTVKAKSSRRVLRGKKQKQDYLKSKVKS